MKKKILIFAMFLLAFTVLTGCVKEQKTANKEQKYNKPGIDENFSSNKEIKMNEEDAQKIRERNEKCKGDVMKLEDGWKRYRNECMGIEFEFEDKENNLEVMGGLSGVTLSRFILEEEKKYLNQDKSQLIYIHTLKLHKKRKLKEDFLIGEQGWDQADNYSSLSEIKEIKNKNNISIYEVQVIVDRCFSKHPSKDCGLVTIDNFYVNYPKEIDKYYNRYITIRGLLLPAGEDVLEKQIVDSLKFID